MLKIALQRMQSIFSAQALQVAETLFKSSGVLRVRLHDGLVKAEVRGDKHFVYGVHFDLKSWPAVAAKCTCGTKHPCVHVAASLLALAVRDTPLSEMNSYSLTKVTTPLRVNLGAAEWYSTLESSDLGLFSYELGIDIQGKKISMLPVLAYCAKCYGPQILDFPDTKLIVCPLPDGTQIEIPLGRIKPLLQFLQEYALRMSSDLDRWELASYDLLKVQALEVELPEIKVRWHTENQIRTRLLAFLSGKSDEKIALPPGVNVQLRDYQWQGVAWLQNLRILQLGGILADDMGLGKTVQVLIHLAIEKTQNRLLKPVLIVAPTSLVRNWQLEAARFTPALRVLVHHGNDRSFEHFDEYDVIVTTYTLVQRDKKHLLQTQFTYLILDEAQYIKNARNKRTQCLQELVVRHRLCLTGTPLENHLEELWSLFHFLMPGFLGDRAYFRKNFRHPIEKEKDIDTQLTLMRRIQPFMLRRTKDAVLQELPEKTEIVQMIHLEGVQRDLYEAIRISMVQKIHKIIQEKGFSKSHVILLDALLKLRQVCCDPRLIRLPEAQIAHGVSAKMEALMALLPTLLQENRKILIFSQFTSMLRIIELAIQAEGYDYLQLTGKSKDRQKLVDSFQQGDAPIFLISLKAGGTGLNLTKADTVIHYDPWWNPAVEDQATGRSHRIGQNNPVFVYKFIASGTVEEAITNMQERKRNLFQGIFSPQGKPLSSLTEEDIDVLFKPL